MSLPLEPTKQLIQVIADNMAMTFDAQYKIMALENVLKEYRPELFEPYRKELEQIKRNPPFSVSVAGLSGLLERLVGQSWVLGFWASRALSCG